MKGLGYPARFTLDDGQWVVEFPDPNNGLGISTWGRTLEEARAMASEALTEYLQAVGADAEDPGSLPTEQGWELIRPAPQVEVAFQVRRLRNDLGLSQQEAAARIGVAYTSYQRWEDPEHCNATVKTLDRIARAFGRQLEVTFR
ncbi:MAG: type II toxin-antitoxin system HicB family antitoxin [Candidatus Eremiobacterota bacterium]